MKSAGKGSFGVVESTRWIWRGCAKAQKVIEGVLAEDGLRFWRRRDESGFHDCEANVEIGRGKVKADGRWKLASLLKPVGGWPQKHRWPMSTN